MEWCCARCGLSARADDWALLLSMGWRERLDGEPRCAICVKKEAARRRPEGPRIASALTAVRGNRGEIR
jgi:hypothetical protein